MGLFDNLNRPILDVLVRIYKKNGVWHETTKQYKERRKNALGNINRGSRMVATDR